MSSKRAPDSRRSALQRSARATLLERRRQLSETLGRAEHEANELYETHEVDWEDQAANVTTATGLERIGDRERAQLVSVVAALDRLDAGTWGNCVACGQDIPDDRLRAMPEATRCAGCVERDRTQPGAAGGAT